MKEEILKVLESIHEAKEAIEINDLLDFHTVEDYKEVEKNLEELVDEYLVYKTKKNRYILVKNCPSIKIGRLTVNKKGYGFVILEKEDDLYIASDNLNGAIHDDYVLSEIIRSGVKKEGRILKILKREINDLVGEIIVKDNEMTIDLDDDKKDLELVLKKESLKNCVLGHKVVIRLEKELGKKKYLASVVRILGHKDDPGVDILSIAYKYAIETEFSPEVEKELESIPSEVDKSELSGRIDLTDKQIFTIDGSHTKDIDDAISLEREGELYILGVHIADVSNYVKENTALGDSAYERGTSCYLADTVIPMIPHKLSNGICSLNEGVVRLTMSCVMKINNRGKVVSYDIFPSYIKSRKKMTYENVNDILMRNIIPDGYEDFVSTLKEMNTLARILRKEKVSRGYIDFDLDEAEVIQDENGHAIDIVKREREDGEILIEDFMIVANETVASHIYNMDLPFIYRTHGIPNSEKIDDFVNLVKLLGYELQTKVTDLTPIAMQKLLDELSEKPEFSILSSMLLRSMKKAEYSKDNIGHFGLGSKAYTHFTSPIRRFPDLTVHRLLKKYLIENDLSMSTISYYDSALIEIAEHSSEKEVGSVNAERDVLDMKMAEYMESHIGEIYTGMISTVTNFGFFVELPNLVEGLVHVSTLKGDFYNYVPEKLALIGNNTKTQYRIGDMVEVKVISASKETAMIDFEIIKSEKNGNQE